MIKKLTLTAALLMPGLAYGANPSADLSVQVVSAVPPPGNIACDYGPNTTLPTGTVGTDLTTAGFTHCVLNADFTDNSGATVNGGWVMNNKNTWLNSCPTPTTTWGKFWLMWHPSGPGFGTNGDGGGPVPCARATLVNDGGTQVLNFQFAASDWSSGGNFAMSLYWPLCGNSCVGMRPALPVALYEEITYRLPSGTAQSIAGIINSRDENSVFDGSPSQGGGFLDMVWIEALAQGGSSFLSLDNYVSTGACGGKCTAGGSWVPPLTTYHTYANLSTTDGSTALSSCHYLDGAGVTFTSTVSWDGTYCGHWINFVGNEINDHDRRNWNFIGWPTLASPPTATISINIKNIRIFACTNYLGSGNNCTGPFVFH
jgi:hypothetical protein